MSCPELGSSGEHVDFRLGLYVLDALHQGEHALVEEHLSSCADCRRTHTQLRAVRAALDRLTPRDVERLGEEYRVDLSRRRPPAG